MEITLSGMVDEREPFPLLSGMKPWFNLTRLVVRTFLLSGGKDLPLSGKEETWTWVDKELGEWVLPTTSHWGLHHPFPLAAPIRQVKASYSVRQLLLGLELLLLVRVLAVGS